jgi:protein-tyrosine phosphatase
VELELQREREIALAAGLRYQSVPIPDRDIPLPGTIEPQLRELAAALRGGAAIAVHCRMGIGRSPLIAASMLRHLGLSMEEAFTRIGAARGFPVPDTEQQRRWVAGLVV